MQTKAKRGRPPKGRDRVKADYLDIRLASSEKATFKDAADLAGLDLSAWVRERLRAVARKELEAAGLPVAFLAKRAEGRKEPKMIPVEIPATRPEHLTDARFVPPSTVDLTFSDARFSLAIELLELPLDRIRWKTAEASATGDAMTVRGKKGELIPIASGTLRYLVDKQYAAKIDAALKSLQFTRDELKALARDNPPPPAWFSQPARDLRRESWK